MENWRDYKLRRDVTDQVTFVRVETAWVHFAAVQAASSVVVYRSRTHLRIRTHHLIMVVAKIAIRTYVYIVVLLTTFAFFYRRSNRVDFSS